MNKILIACKCGWQFPKRRERCRRTWLAQIKEAHRHDEWLDLRAVLYFGVPEVVRPEQYGDYLFLPAPNGYEYLPQRMQLLCRWATGLEWPWEYLWCMDDDTRISLPRLVGYDTAGADYIGPEWRPGVGYASGGGHFLSRRAAAIVAACLLSRRGADDLLVGDVLLAAGIPLTVDNDHFRVLMPLDAEPGPENDWVYCTPGVREPE